MCVSLETASFSNTIVYAGEALKDGRIVHVLGYSNSVFDAPRMQRPGRFLGFFRRQSRPTGNAMLLHFPAKTPMGPGNIVDTTACPHLLQGMVTTLWPPTRSRAAALDFEEISAATVFDSGIYTVVLARDAKAIPAALARVPPEKRPNLNPAIFDWYQTHLAGWSVALCCFAGHVIAPPPLLWWYEPIDESVLFAPGLDAHDGTPPRLGIDVDVDHRLIFGSHLLENGKRLALSDVPPDVGALLPSRVVGTFVGGRLANGDFLMDVSQVRAGNAHFTRGLLHRDPSGLSV